MTTITAPELWQEIRIRAAGRDRILVGIAGPPGSGKSTLAADLAAQLGPSAAVLPMDGFHLENDRLRQMGLLNRKGAPETFDAEAFVRLVGKVRGGGGVSYPTFDREADRTIPDGGHIDKDTRIVIAEGNYLLLNTPPWSGLSGLFDLTVRLEAEREEIETRLVKRWLDHGLPTADARARALGNDMQNVKIVIENSIVPDFVLQTSE